MNFSKNIFLIILITTITCLGTIELELETPQLENIYENWQKLLETTEDDPLLINKIRTEADSLSNNLKNSVSLDIARKGFLLLEIEADSLLAENLKNRIITDFPASQETYDLAYEEFYDLIYPIWRNDSLKVAEITKLLDKYSQTGWRRTMYQYLLYSLDQIGEMQELRNRLEEFRQTFPADYLPWLLTARYLDPDEAEPGQLTEYATTALERSYDYPQVDFYPDMEWQLEARSAPIKAVAVLARILNEQERYEESIKKLEDAIFDNSLTVEDETTLARCYYYLAQAYEGLERYDLAEENAALAIIAGDSRNYYTPRTDTLLTELLSRHRGYNFNLNYSRKIMEYQDVIFNDVTAETGLADINAGRIAWGDYDSDGWQDILLNGSRLFRNLEGKKFVEVTSTAFPDTIRGNGGLWGDVDNDGDLDIVTKDPESVWLNELGIFRKSDSFADNGVSTEGLGLGDVNQDGFLDLYVANYEKNYVYEADQFFLGSKDSLFVEATKKCSLVPVDKVNRAGRGVNFGDYDNDGDLDIFVSNYRLTRNFLWQNNGLGNFTEVALAKGVSGVEVDDWWGHTIGSEWGDIDNDGDLDLISCNLAHPRYIDFSDKTMLLINSGFPNYKFTDKRAFSGIRYEETHSEPALGDLNNDGYLDLYINDVYEGRKSFLYMSNGDLTFRDVTYLSGTRHYNGWGVAFADFDNDGDLDILAAGGEIQLFRNDTPDPGNWLQIEIVGKDHSDAIGTRLILKNENISLLREIQGGKGTTNQQSLVQHFGLGKAKPPFDLIIRFPDGNIRKIKVLEVNWKVVIYE